MWCNSKEAKRGKNEEETLVNNAEQGISRETENNEDRKFLQKLLQKHFDVNKKNTRGQTVIHIAAEQGFIESLKFLTKIKGIDLNIKDNNGKTAFDCALKRVNCHKLLKKRAESINESENTGNVVAFIENFKLFYRQSPEVTDKIYFSDDKSIDSQLKTFHRYVVESHKEDVETFIKHENNVGFTDKVNEVDQTAVHIAAELKNSEILDILLEKSENIDQQDILGKTPLHISVENNDAKCVELLLNRNASVLKRDLLDRTPLQIAAKNNTNKKMLRTLLKMFKKQLQEQTFLCKLCEKNLDPRKDSSQKDSNSANKVNKKDRSRYFKMFQNQEQLKFKSDLTKTCNICKGEVDLGLTEYNDPTTCLDVIFKHAEKRVEFLHSILSTRIKDNGTKDNEKKFLFDFRLLSPGRNKYQMKTIDKILSVANKNEKHMLFNHPLFETFLALKENKLIFKLIYYVELFLLILYWIFIYVYFIKMNHSNEADKMTLNIARVGAISFASIHIFIGLLKQGSKPWKNRTVWNHEKFFEILLNFVNPVVIITIGFLEFFRMALKSWVSHYLLIIFTSLSSLSVSIEPFYIFSKFSRTENYFEVLVAVFKKVAMLLFTFLSLFVGFAVSFHILFQHKTEFVGFWRPILKTLVMMSGEFGYDEMFDHPDEKNQSQIKEKLDSSIPRVIFVLFMIIANIVFVNITIGVAIDDSKTLQEKYKKRKVKKQAERLVQIEYFFYYLASEYMLEWFLNQCYVNPIWELTESQIGNLSQKLLKHVQERNERSNHEDQGQKCSDNKQVIGTRKLTDGNDKLASFRGLPDRIWIYVGNTTTDTKKQQVKAYLEKQFPGKRFSVESLPMRNGAESSSFKVGADLDLMEDLYDPTIWPCGVVVKKFKFER